MLKSAHNEIHLEAGQTVSDSQLTHMGGWKTLKEYENHSPWANVDIKGTETDKEACALCLSQPTAPRKPPYLLLFIPVKPVSATFHQEAHPHYHPFQVKSGVPSHFNTWGFLYITAFYILV